MTEDLLRRLLQSAAASAPEPGDFWRGADRRSIQIRRRRARRARYGGSALATVAVFLVAIALRPDSEVAVSTPPAVATAPGPTGSIEPTSRTPDPTERDKAGSFGLPIVTDDFSGPLDRSLWVIYAEGTNSPYSRWSTDDVSVSDGELRISARRPGNDYPPYTTGGVGGIPTAREYGRFTVRLKMTEGFNIVGQVMLAPAEPGDPGSLLTIGSDRRRGTLSGQPDGRETAVVLPAAVTDYRTVAVEWSPQSIRWTLDGAELNRSNVSPRGAHYLALQVLALGPDCGADRLVPSCPRRLPLPQVLSVDRVSIQPYRGG